MLPGAALPAKPSSSKKGSGVCASFTVKETGCCVHCPIGSHKSLKMADLIFTQNYFVRTEELACISRLLYLYLSLHLSFLLL